jgi:hypothetical protein
MPRRINPYTTGKFLALVFAVITLVSISTAVIARAASPTPNPSASPRLTPSPAARETEPDETATENVKKRVLENAAAKIRGVIDSIISDKRAIVGEIIRVTGEAITIKNNSGQTIIPITESTQILRGDQTIEIDDIVVGNWATVLGTPNEVTAIDPNYIVISNTSLRPRSQFVTLGTISSISRTAIIVTTRSNGTEQEIKITTNTTFEDAAGQEILLSNLEEDVAVLVTGFQAETETGLPEARTIRSLGTNSGN